MLTDLITGGARPFPAVASATAAPVRAVLRRIAARLDAQDAAARARGWTVEVRPAGRRVYRDPRFDRLAASTAAALDDSGQPTVPASSGALR